MHPFELSLGNYILPLGKKKEEAAKFKTNKNRSKLFLRIVSDICK